MPTNILRRRSDASPDKPTAASERKATTAAGRVVLIRAGRVRIRVRLLDTLTAARIWQQLPIFSTAETWGQCIHFETPVETGRERGARLNVAPGDICYWAEDDRVMIGFGPTPISRPDEIRLMRPCNLWATAIDDVRALAGVTPGEKVSMTRGE